MDIYTKEGGKIFVSYGHSFLKGFLILVFFAGGCGAIGWYHGAKLYDSKKKKKDMDQVHDIAATKITRKLGDEDE